MLLYTACSYHHILLAHSYRLVPNPYRYKGELGFFDNYVIPLAKKLKECNVFGVSSDECLNYALQNRAEWEERGQDIVKEMQQAIEDKVRAAEAWESMPGEELDINLADTSDSTRSSDDPIKTPTNGPEATTTVVSKTPLSPTARRPSARLRPLSPRPMPVAAISRPLTPFEAFCDEIVDC